MPAPPIELDGGLLVEPTLADPALVRTSVFAAGADLDLRLSSEPGLFGAVFVGLDSFLVPIPGVFGDFATLPIKFVGSGTGDAGGELSVSVSIPADLPATLPVHFQGIVLYPDPEDARLTPVSSLSAL